jgi:hypothetical protein
MTGIALAEVAVIGIDIGKNTFHAIGLNQRGAIVLRQKWSRRQIADRLAKNDRRTLSAYIETVLEDHLHARMLPKE